MIVRTTPRRSPLLLVLALGMGVGAVACGSDLGDSTGSTCPAESTLTYDNFGKNFMQTHCLACHADGGSESPALSTLAEIQAHLGDVDRAAAAGPNAVNTFMPEGSSVPEEERRKLGEWLACGAPE